MEVSERENNFGVMVQTSEGTYPRFYFCKTIEERDIEFNRILNDKNFYVPEMNKYVRVLRVQKIQTEPTVYKLR